MQTAASQYKDARRVHSAFQQSLNSKMFPHQSAVQSCTRWLRGWTSSATFSASLNHLSQLNDLSTTCQFCPTCKQFVEEWSHIQTKMTQLQGAAQLKATTMTQLTQRAAQLKSTLSALLLSAPQIQKEVDVTNIINNRIQNSQEVELSLLLQQTVDDIRNQLQKEYSVNVLVEKVQVPCPPKSKLNHEELDPLSGHCDSDNFSSEDQMDNKETSEQIFETADQIEEETSSVDSNGSSVSSSDDSDGSSVSIELKETKAKQKSKSQKTQVIRKSRTGGKQKETSKPDTLNDFIPDGPNRFTYEGMLLKWNEDDQSYTCGTCGFKSTLGKDFMRKHIRRHIENPSIVFRIKKSKPSRARAIYTQDGPNTFKYNGYGFKLSDEDQHYYCDVCNHRGTTYASSIMSHIRVHYTEEDKLKYTAVKTSDTEWVYREKYKIVRVGEKYKCVSCGYANFELKHLSNHMRAEHVDMEGSDQVQVPLPATDTPNVNDSTPIQGEYKSFPYTFDPSNSKYTCGICQREVGNSRSQFGKHISNHHTDAANTSTGRRDLTRVICELCGKEISRASYKSHKRRHEADPQNCPTCNKTYFCPLRFKKHLESHRLGEADKSFQCEHCGNTFNTKREYRDHLSRHTGEKPYECQDCGKKYGSGSALLLHRKTQHGYIPGFHRLARVNE